MSTLTTSVHEYEPGLEDYCARCNAPEKNRRHRVENAPLSSVYDLPDDAAKIDAGIRRCLEAGMETFSANDMRDELDAVKNRSVIGPRFAKWKDKGYIREVGHVRSIQNRTKSKVVAEYAAGPRWRKAGGA